jgi:hypothetical protein
MRDILLQAGGMLGILVAAVHGVLGETKVFARARIEPAWVRALLRAVWQAGAVAWAGLALLLIAAPAVPAEALRHWIIGIAVTVFLVGAAANAWATKGRHLGWVALLAVCSLAVAGWCAECHDRSAIHASSFSLRLGSVSCGAPDEPHGGRHRTGGASECVECLAGRVSASVGRIGSHSPCR